MSGNKYLIADRSLLLQKKLEQLAVNLSGKLGNNTLQTNEAYLSEAIRILNEFYKSIQEPQLDEQLINYIRVDDLPDVDLYNKIWQQILDDLICLFSELENIETLTLSNFNNITTENNRLVARLKAVDSKLGDYILFSLSSDKNIIYYKDSYNDLSKIDIGSPLLNEEECYVDQVEGIVTLPVDKEKESTITVKQLPIINSNSNGFVGSNYELGTPFNGDLSLLLDSNPDTWFEYERVVTKNNDDKTPLILDLTLNIGEEKVINNIRVNPNNFGTKTVIQILDISTSLDGSFYTSIKDDIPIAGFTTQDEENIFTLAPSTSKYAGQGMYTFTPRNAKYIHFTFKQSEAYVIDTSSGEQLRYAIGLRDIEIRGIFYKNKGELISKEYSTLKEINKISIDTNQNPTVVSELAKIQYFISIDNGGSWHELVPRSFQSSTNIVSVPEILNFNTGDENEIKTSVNVKTLRLKTVFTREDDKFEDGSSTLSKKVVSTAEMHEIPRSSPFTITLNHPPVNETITVIDSLFGSRGIQEAQYVIGHATDKIDTRRYRLPFQNFPVPMQKTSDGESPATYHLEPVSTADYIHVEVGGEEWTHATQPINDYTLDFSDISSYKVFLFDPNKGILEFGDGITNTLSPSENQPISLYFDAERLFPSEDDEAHLALLDFKTSSNKDDFIIKRYGLIKRYTETLPRKATVLRLAYQYIQDTTLIKTAMSVSGQSFDAEPQTFVNGKDEFTTTNNWSIDTEAGIVYTARPTSAIQDLSLTYTYQPIFELTTDDWDWGTSDLLRDSIIIKNSGWETIEVIDEELPTTTNITILDLSKMSIVKGGLNISVEVDGDDPEDDVHPFLKEVDYINGTEEFGQEFKKITESIPINITPVANVATFSLKENISTQTSNHIVSFSNTTLFETNVYPSVPSSFGQYSVDRSAASPNYGKVSFYTMFAQAMPGVITYYCASDHYSNNGLYSIDYKYGRIYTQRPINPSNNETYSILCSYQYTDYRAEYRIARFLNLNSYDVDVVNRTITFKDKEILKYMETPHSSYTGREHLYLVNYDYVDETRENIEALKEKFTPILKDYAIKILTKGGNR